MTSLLVRRRWPSTGLFSLGLGYWHCGSSLSREEPRGDCPRLTTCSRSGPTARLEDSHSVNLSMNGTESDSPVLVPGKAKVQASCDMQDTACCSLAPAVPHKPFGTPFRKMRPKWTIPTSSKAGSPAHCLQGNFYCTSPFYGEGCISRAMEVVILTLDTWRTS